MSAPVLSSTSTGPENSGVGGRFHAWAVTGQNWVVVLCMAVMAVLPVVEIVLRKFFRRA